MNNSLSSMNKRDSFGRVKRADSLSDAELLAIAKHYNKDRNDRLTVSGDIGRILLSGGSLPITMMYDLNRTGGTQLLAPLFGRKRFNYRASTQKKLDKNNALLKAIYTGMGGALGAYIGNNYSWSDKEQNTAIGGAAGAAGTFLLMHIAQKLGQNRAKKMLKRLEEQQTKMNNSPAL